MKLMYMSTLKELAASLNLSVMAVSKALRDAPDISVGTKARVQAEARRRNYIPNRAAQNLRLRRSGLLGIVVPQINHTYYSHLVWGAERQAEAMGLQVLLGHSLDRAEALTSPTNLSRSPICGPRVRKSVVLGLFFGI